MAIYKRGRIYWYKFTFNGAAIRESTRQTNQNVARQMEAAHRTSLAKGEVGIRDKKPIPTLSQFCAERFEPWTKSNFEKGCRSTWVWYRSGVRAILEHKPIAKLRLDEIRAEQLMDFVAHRQALGLQVSYVNGSLRVLRRILRLAVQWGVLESCPKIELLPGEHQRERVITPEEEARYLAGAPPLLASVATLLIDTGLRPEECHRLRWEDITWVNGRNGTLLITRGKTKAARRVLPMTVRVRTVLEERWLCAGKPEDGWVWPAPTKGGHLNHFSLRKQHQKTLKATSVRTFVLYSLRHTFLTRLGASGCDAWTLARIAGHSSISISSRYVHPSEDSVLDAMSRLGGHKFGHTRPLSSLEGSHKRLELVDSTGEVGGPSRI